SKPAAAGLTQASTIGALHLAQRRRSIPLAVVGTGNDCDAGTRFPLTWAGALHSQSPVDARPGGDRTSMHSRVAVLPVHIAHFPKLNKSCDRSGNGAGGARGFSRRR